MANLKDLYDPEVISSIVTSYSDEVKQYADGENPLDSITRRQLEVTEGQSAFSTLLGWTPESIPDFPITVYKRTDWPKPAQLHIPAVDPHWVWNKPVTEMFALAMHKGDTTLLHGLAGTGKSCLAEQWCAMLNIPFWRMNCNRETRESHFLGSPSVEYNDKGQMFIKQEPTLLTDSLKYGGMFCEDEAFRHNSALVLQSLRERSNRSVLLPDAPGRTANERKLTAPEGKWWYVLTDNTCGSGDETGIFDAEVQDASTLDRVDSAIEVVYLDKDQERIILKNHSQLNDTIINGMLDVAKVVRNSFANQNIMATLSVRGLLSWADNIELMGSIGKGLQLSWYNKLGTDDQAVVHDIFSQVFGRTIDE